MFSNFWNDVIFRESVQLPNLQLFLWLTIKTNTTLERKAI